MTDFSCTGNCVTPRPVYYKRGDYFLLRNNELVILTLVGPKNKMCLVTLRTGNRFKEPITVSDFNRVTQYEIEEMLTREYRYDIEHVSSVDITFIIEK